eukprot:12458535-Alexandrium_andersonii.AAC.1
MLADHVLLTTLGLRARALRVHNHVRPRKHLQELVISQDAPQVAELSGNGIASKPGTGSTTCRCPWPGSPSTPCGGQDGESPRTADA